MNIKLDESKIKLIRFGDENYPEKLKHIYSKPQKLYILGNECLLNEKSIAIIGCRKCTDYGAKTAYRFGFELAKKGICVISGFARGIDSFSHLGAVKAGAKTIAVLRIRARYNLSRRKF